MDDFPDTLSPDEARALSGGERPDEQQSAPALPETMTPSEAASAANAAQTPVLSSPIWPVSRYADKSVQFDPHAGIVGQALNAFNLPGDVLTGKIPYGGPEMTARAANLAGLATPMGPAGKIMEAGVPAVRAMAAPTEAALKAAGDAGYNAARQMGVLYSLPKTVDWAHATGQSLYQKGMMPIPESAPGTHAVLDALRTPPAGSYGVPFAGGMEGARRQLSALTTAPGQEGKAARDALSSLDDFMSNPENVLTGDAQRVSSLLKEANGNYAAMQRAKGLANLEEKAEMQKRPTADALRAYLTTKMDPTHPERMAGFSPEEKQAIGDFLKGSTAEKTLETVARLTGMKGGHPGLGSMGIGWLAERAMEHAGTEPLSLPSLAAFAAPAAIGYGANAGREAMARRAFENVQNLIRMRSPYYQQQATRPGLSAIEGTGLGAAKALPLTAPPPPRQWLRPGELGA